MADVIVEDVGPCKKTLRISIPQSEIHEKVEETYTRLKESAVVDGFRKGHVPRKLLERRFGEEVIDEVKRHADRKAVLLLISRAGNDRFIAVPLDKA